MPEFAALVEGYKRFRREGYVEQKARFDHLASEGQAPPIMIISCCDSRVDPATIFDTVPGQVFALRTGFLQPLNLACWGWASNILLCWAMPSVGVSRLRWREAIWVCPDAVLSMIGWILSATHVMRL
jgi:hypothetical protein